MKKHIAYNEIMVEWTNPADGYDTEDEDYGNIYLQDWHQVWLEPRANVWECLGQLLKGENTRRFPDWEGVRFCNLLKDAGISDYDVCWALSPEGEMKDRGE